MTNPTDFEPPDGRPAVVAVMGPTGVGKTRLGVEISLAMHGEVVSADSRYLYRGFDIGVAKPTQAERRGVPHHLIDIADPTDDVFLATYQRLASGIIDRLTDAGTVPVLVGGTPLYMNALLEGWNIPEVPPNPGLRAALEAEARTEGLAVLTARLATIDPTTAATSGQNERRVIRALEVFEATGRPISELQGKGPRPYRTLELGLRMPRALLHAAIDRRVDAQIEAGLVHEVEGLLAQGIPVDAPAMTSLGYRQLAPHLLGEITLEEAVARTKFAIHRYVRHQETWLRRNPRIVWLDVTEDGWIDRSVRLVGAFLPRLP